MPPVDDPPPHDDPTTAKPGSEAVEPPNPTAGIRIDDAARYKIGEELGRHFADGRIDQDEYEERLERTYAARFDTDLAPVTADLPSIGTNKNLEQRSTTTKRMVVGWLSLAVLFVVIWALSDPGGYFWPIWPILGTGLGTFPAAYAERRDKS